ncbi:MAG: response regulator [Cyanobacteria bacterium J06560_5]
MSYATDQTILIVDDMPTNVEVLAGALIKAGYQVAVALDGESAIAQIQYKSPALILLDVMMPGIDGFETCRRLKESPQTRAIPIIFMTALSETVNKSKGFSLGAVDYITKPFDAQEVLARVGTHLRLYQLTTQLEETVETRTAELTVALEKLKQSQSQLIQTEKMSGLGQLVAGIAHEINNPVSFIHGNVKHTNNYVCDLIELLALYQENYPQPTADIQAKMEEIDINFLMEDLPKMVTSMKMGTDRIRQIVLSLRNFSRMDEAVMKPVDIHEGIDNTLLILQSRLKANSQRPAIEIVKDYSPLPPVECYASQLNQVFMNLIANALDALDDAMSQGKLTKAAQIHIQTDVIQEKWVRIQIADNGPGIPTAIKEKLFDPFFTTKPVGKGTGLGLSISYKIITGHHQGKIWCESTPDLGTAFFVEIPRVLSYVEAK